MFNQLPAILAPSKSGSSVPTKLNSSYPLPMAPQKATRTRKRAPIPSREPSAPVTSVQQSLPTYTDLEDFRPQLPSSTNLKTTSSPLSGNATSTRDRAPALPASVRVALAALWAVDPRVPSVPSRQAWARARGLPPPAVHGWFRRARASAVKRGIAVSEDSYELALDSPGESLMKIEDRSSIPKNEGMTQNLVEQRGKVRIKVEEEEAIVPKTSKRKRKTAGIANAKMPVKKVKSDIDTSQLIVPQVSFEHYLLDEWSPLDNNQEFSLLNTAPQINIVYESLLSAYAEPTSSHFAGLSFETRDLPHLLSPSTSTQTLSDLSSYSLESFVGTEINPFLLDAIKYHHDENLSCGGAALDDFGLTLSIDGPAFSNSALGLSRPGAFFLDSLGPNISLGALDERSIYNISGPTSFHRPTPIPRRNLFSTDLRSQSPPTFGSLLKIAKHSPVVAYPDRDALISNRSKSFNPFHLELKKDPKYIKHEQQPIESIFPFLIFDSPPRSDITTAWPYIPPEWITPPRACPQFSNSSNNDQVAADCPLCLRSPGIVPCFCPFPNPSRHRPSTQRRNFAPLYSLDVTY